MKTAEFFYFGYVIRIESLTINLNEAYIEKVKHTLKLHNVNKWHQEIVGILVNSFGSEANFSVEDAKERVSVTWKKS
jgi:hypothetical protein